MKSNRKFFGGLVLIFAFVIFGSSICAASLSQENLGIDNTQSFNLDLANVSVQLV
jgi:hypothetical protein